MGLRRGFYRLTVVWWGLGLVACVAMALWSGGNPWTLRHPEALPEPPEVPPGICLSGAWDDGAGSALAVIERDRDDTSEAWVSRFRGWVSTPPAGPDLEPDDERVTVRFSGPLWAHYEARGSLDRWLGDRFDLDFRSLVQCSSFWSEKADDARAEWRRVALPGYQLPALRRVWARAGVAALLWTVALWLLYALAAWVARGFRS